MRTGDFGVGSARRPGSTAGAASPPMRGAPVGMAGSTSWVQAVRRDCRPDRSGRPNGPSGPFRSAAATASSARAAGHRRSVLLVVEPDDRQVPRDGQSQVGRCLVGAHRHPVVETEQPVGRALPVGSRSRIAARYPPAASDASADHQLRPNTGTGRLRQPQPETLQTQDGGRDVVDVVQETDPRCPCAASSRTAVSAPPTSSGTTDVIAAPSDRGVQQHRRRARRKAAGRVSTAGGTPRHR